tara:strand:- start:1775 stop:2677 length:903 start_codon:yes stop_codon:yes gene_type:complete
MEIITVKYLILIILIIIMVFVNNKKYNLENFSNNNKVNIVMSCDQNQFIGVLATVNSICKYSNKKYNEIIFYFLVNKNEKNILDNLIKKVPYEIDYKIKEIYQDNKIQDNIRVNSKISNVDNIMNFIRFNFTEELPNLNKILYIDADIIIKDDIIQLYHNCNINKSPFYAVKINNFKNIGDIQDLSSYNPNADYFNAGLYITSLKYWRENNLKFKAVELMKKHKKSKKGLFKLGTQPILNILFYNNFTKINEAWNTGGLGFKKVDVNKIKNAKGLHWTGPKKPWKQDGLYKELWEPYNLL